MSATSFDRDKIIELLTELGRRLSAKGVAGRLYVVGGAAMALQFDTRRATRHIDAVMHPPTTWLTRPPPWPQTSACRWAG